MNHLPGGIWMRYTNIQSNGFFCVVMVMWLLLISAASTAPAQEIHRYVFTRYFHVLYNDGKDIYKVVSEEIHNFSQSPEKIVDVNGNIEGVSGTFNNGLWVAFLKDGNKIMVCKTPCTAANLPAPVAVENQQLEITPPTIVTFDSWLYVAWCVNSTLQGKDFSQMFLSRSPDGNTWTDPQQYQFQFVNKVGKPDMTVLNGDLYIAVPVGKYSDPTGVVIRKIAALDNNSQWIDQFPFEFYVPGSGSGLIPESGVSICHDGSNLCVCFHKDFLNCVTKTRNISENGMEWIGMISSLERRKSVGGTLNPTLIITPALLGPAGDGQLYFADAGGFNIYVRCIGDGNGNGGGQLFRITTGASTRLNGVDMLYGPPLDLRLQRRTGRTWH